MMKRIESTEALKYIQATEEVRSKEEAIEQKMKFLQPKLFGYPLVNYSLKGMRKVYIPYSLLVFHYVIDRKIGLRREGEMAVIFDLNEVHPFHYDLADGFNTRKLRTENLDGDFLPINCTDEEAQEKSINTIQWKGLYRAYRSKGELTLLRSEKFYRPVWELDLDHKGRQFIRYAPLDTYGSSNEHLSGLKIRLEN